MSGVFIQEINQRFSSVSEFESVSSAQPIVPQSFPSPQDALGSGNLQDSFTFGSEKISGHFRSQHFHGRKGFSNYSNFLHLLGSSLGQDPSTSGWVRPPGEDSSASGCVKFLGQDPSTSGWVRPPGEGSSDSGCVKSLGQDPSTSGWVRPLGEGSSDSGCGKSSGQDPSTSGWVRPPGEDSSASGWKSDINKPIFACGWARSSG